MGFTGKTSFRKYLHFNWFNTNCYKETFERTFVKITL